MGSDGYSRAKRKTADVSIHAPTWGATYKANIARKDYEFQSTLPHGERLILHHTGYGSVRVSIHAPTWGATFIFVLFVYW